MPEAWPDAQALYEFPGGDREKAKRWSKAIEDALAGGGLRMEFQHADLYSLRGDCPRCGHQMSQVIDFAVYAPKDFSIGRKAQPGLTVDVVCSCSSAHKGRGDSDSGCGWGRGLPMPMGHPAGGA